MRGWYHDRGRNLPPGLAKRDQLPPGLERQLRVRGTLPPGSARRRCRVQRNWSAACLRLRAGVHTLWSEGT
jgi:hypothetical protein